MYGTTLQPTEPPSQGISQIFIARVLPCPGWSSAANSWLPAEPQSPPAGLLARVQGGSGGGEGAAWGFGGVGRGPACAEASVERGPSGGEICCGRAGSRWKKKQAQDQVTQARSLNFILCARPASKGFRRSKYQKAPLAAVWRTRLEGTRPKVEEGSASLVLSTALGARKASVFSFVR